MPRTVAPLAAILTAVVFVGLLVYGVAAKSDRHTLDNAVASGHFPPVPKVSLPLLTGAGQRTLADFRGHVVVLNLWASWCDPCRAEAPLLEREQHALTARGATVLGVTFRDTTPDSQAFVRRYGLTYPNLRDVDGKLAASLDTKALPETFVIDSRSRIVAVSRGQVSRSFLDAAVRLASRS